jgi:hypothetical protein
MNTQHKIVHSTAPLTPVPFSKRTEPSIPADDPRYVWTTGADVQATWKRFGWTPIGEKAHESTT